MNNQVNERQMFCLLKETEISIKLLKHGLSALQNISRSNTFYHLPFLLLSSGFERLMKSMICFAYLNDNNSFPSNEYLKSHFSHRLQKLKNYILSDCFKYDSLATKTDYDFITSDTSLNKTISFISDFADIGRYHYFDEITGKKSNNSDIEQKWQKYEIELLHNDKELLAKSKDDSYDVYPDLNTKIIINLERFIRALSRQYSLGKLGSDAKRTSAGIMNHFIFLQDTDLGKTDYGNGGRR